jgi:hypothetical protein
MRRRRGVHGNVLPRCHETAGVLLARRNFSRGSRRVPSVVNARGWRDVTQAADEIDERAGGGEEVCVVQTVIDFDRRQSPGYGMSRVVKALSPEKIIKMGCGQEPTRCRLVVSKGADFVSESASELILLEIAARLLVN